MKFEPALLIAFIRSCLYALVLFGFEFSHEQIGGLVLVVETGGALFIRSQTVTTAHVTSVLDSASTTAAQDADIKQNLGIDPPVAT